MSWIHRKKVLNCSLIKTVKASGYGKQKSNSKIGYLTLKIAFLFNSAQYPWNNINVIFSKICNPILKGIKNRKV